MCLAHRAWNLSVEVPKEISGEQFPPHKLYIAIMYLVDLSPHESQISISISVSLATLAVCIHVYAFIYAYTRIHVFCKGTNLAPCHLKISLLTLARYNKSTAYLDHCQCSMCGCHSAMFQT